mgnify:CR=1 FL=1
MNQVKKEKIKGKEVRTIAMCTKAVLCSHPGGFCWECEEFEVRVISKK